MHIHRSLFWVIFSNRKTNIQCYAHPYCPVGWCTIVWNKARKQKTTFILKVSKSISQGQGLILCGACGHMQHMEPYSLEISLKWEKSLIHVVLNSRQQIKISHRFWGLRRRTGGDGLVTGILTFLSSPSTTNKAAAAAGPGPGQLPLCYSNKAQMEYNSHLNRHKLQDKVDKDAFVSHSLRWGTVTTEQALCTPTGCMAVFWFGFFLHEDRHMLCQVLSKVSNLTSNVTIFEIKSRTGGQAFLWILICNLPAGRGCQNPVYFQTQTIKPQYGNLLQPERGKLSA